MSLRSHIRRLEGGDSRDESSYVKVLSGRRASNPPSRSIKRTLQPRYANRRGYPESVGTVVRRACAKKGKAIVDGEEMTKGNRPANRGTGDGAVGQTRCLNWGSSRLQPLRGRRAKIRRTKEISQRKQARVSDEAIVSSELGGQQNLPGSQGPLDRVVVATAPAKHAFGPKGANARAVAAYKREGAERMRALRLTSVSCREGRG
jgi:hypothetical protein